MPPLLTCAGATSLPPPPSAASSPRPSLEAACPLLGSPPSPRRPQPRRTRRLRPQPRRPRLAALSLSLDALASPPCRSPCHAPHSPAPFTFSSCLRNSYCAGCRTPVTLTRPSLAPRRSSLAAPRVDALAAATPGRGAEHACIFYILTYIGNFTRRAPK